MGLPEFSVLLELPGFSQVHGLAGGTFLKVKEGTRLALIFGSVTVLSHGSHTGNVGLANAQNGSINRTEPSQRNWALEQSKEIIMTVVRHRLCSSYSMLGIYAYYHISSL